MKKQSILEHRIQARHLLSQSNLRCTHSRIGILNILLDSDHPLTHEEIFNAVNDMEINRVTVYRVLQSLWESGIVHRVEAGDRLWRFAVCGCKKPGHCHPHFKCRICGRIECLSDYKLPNIDMVVAGNLIEEQEVYLKGQCASCLSKKNHHPNQELKTKP